MSTVDPRYRGDYRTEYQTNNCTQSSMYFTREARVGKVNKQIAELPVTKRIHKVVVMPLNIRVFIVSYERYYQILIEES